MHEKKKPSDDFHDIREGGEYVGLSYSAMKRLMEDGEIEYLKLGTRKYVFTTQQLDDYLARCRQNAPQSERMAA